MSLYFRLYRFDDRYSSDVPNEHLLEEIMEQLRKYNINTKMLAKMQFTLKLFLWNHVSFRHIPILSSKISYLMQYSWKTWYAIDKIILFPLTSDIFVENSLSLICHVSGFWILNIPRVLYFNALESMWDGMYARCSVHLLNSPSMFRDWISFSILTVEINVNMHVLGRKIENIM